jgi:hypothetical protein
VDIHHCPPALLSNCCQTGRCFPRCQRRNAAREPAFSVGMAWGQSQWPPQATISTLTAALLLVACEGPTTHPGPPHPIKTGPGTLAITVADLPEAWRVDPTVTGSITSPRFGDSANDTAYPTSRTGETAACASPFRS